MDDACYRDSDGDGYGDKSPPNDAEEGTDCDDENEFTFPGAAELESTSMCMTDQDGDGYTALDYGGDDCDDTNSIFSENYFFSKTKNKKAFYKNIPEKFNFDFLYSEILN